MLCLTKQSLHHSLPAVQKCNSLRDHGHRYEVLHLWNPISPVLNPTDYKIWGIVRQQINHTKVQDVKDLMQRLIDMWTEVEESFIDDATDQWRRRLHASLHAAGHFE